MLPESQPGKDWQPLLFLRSLRLWELTPTSPKRRPKGPHPASDNAPRSCDKLATTSPKPPPGTKSQTPPRPPQSTRGVLPAPPLPFYSKVGPGPTSSALSRESSKRTLVRLSFPHRSPLPPLQSPQTLSAPSHDRNFPGRLPTPPRPLPGPPPPGVTQDPQSPTEEAQC